MGQVESIDDTIRCAAQGDHAALSLLLVHVHDRMIRYIRRRMPLDLERVLDAEDVLQDAFAAAFQQIGTLRGTTEASFVSWLTTIAQNRLRNVAKAHRARKRGGDGALRAGGRLVTHANGPNGDGLADDLVDLLSRSTRSPRSVAGNREYAAMIRQAVTELEPDHRAVLRMRFVENLPHAAIAEEVGRTEAAVRQLCLRALRRLRSLLPVSSQDMSVA